MPIWNINGDDYDVCPLRSIGEDDAQIIRWYKFYKSGHLPLDGGMLDQSNWFIEAVDYIERF